MSFVHLHCHTEFSLLDGAAKITDMAARAAELNQPAISITDHGSLSGAFALWKEAGKHGIKPIIGSELYVAPGDRTSRQQTFWGTEDQRSRDVSGAGSYTHLTVLATDGGGLRSLFQLQYEAYRTGFYRKPRVDRDQLASSGSGLIILSGCASSELSTLLRLGLKDQAEEYVEWAKYVFGDRFYVEIMHHGISTPELDEDRLNSDLRDIAAAYGINVVATNDLHYCHEEDASVHDALLCLQTRSKLTDERRFRFNGSGFFLKSREQMESSGKFFQHELDETLSIADRIGSYDEVFQSVNRMPKWRPDVDAVSEPEHLAKLAIAGLQDRIPDYSTEYARQLEYELDVIGSMGYAGYFLTIHRIMEAARERKITFGPGRGSGGGSLVAFALKIHDLDPLEHGLLFERLLNPGRRSLPDIDVDVDDSQRADLLLLIRELYGYDHVAPIGTFSTIGAKRALSDAVFVRGESYREGEELKSLLPPPVFGRQPSLSDTFKPDHSGSVQLAFGLEGLIRGEGIHAAGVVICPEPLPSVLPLRGKDVIATGFDMGEVDELGLVKIDFLGLKNLGVINECKRMLGTVDVRLPRVLSEFNDKATFKLLSSGYTTGVFQLDSPGMRGVLRKLRPRSLGDVAAVLSLYRPGPMGVDAHLRYCERGTNSIHPELDRPLSGILGETYGLIVFQEQVMSVLAEVAGWGYSEAGLLFDAMRKKNQEKMAATQPAFYAAATARGFSKEALDALWATLVPFADYSFNRAHATGYAYIAYWTAYLKANYPVEYMAALLTRETEPDKLAEYLAEAQRMGIQILPPDVNASEVGWTPTKQGLRFGLCAIKGVGSSAATAVIKSRPYASVHDFFERAPNRALNTGVLTALVRVGSFDSLWPNREGLLAEASVLAETAIRDRNMIKSGQRRFGKIDYTPKNVGSSIKWSVRQSAERELLGGVILSHKPIQLVLPPNATESMMRWIWSVLSPGSQSVQITIPKTSVRIDLKCFIRQEVHEALKGAGVDIKEG